MRLSGTGSGITGYWCWCSVTDQGNDDVITGTGPCTRVLIGVVDVKQGNDDGITGCCSWDYRVLVLVLGY